ncbi:molybdenum cofactor guanylyltransferase [Thermocrinis jamiesonii]|jgi:Molybdopterin-guanine dinucleotide biosynthesis protein A|uniref:molybdenum cofactor guanylyltransferase n=1 Tax=Thermocrinis jamiesonii TaxID=1302351 RepID=UPI0004965F1C|nr:molybdenum cofactor guanylyltransferase [Thermocrinis jamiesonii]
MIECYVLAGGQSRRFGEDKTLFHIDGVPCIQRVTQEARKVCDKVFVVSKDTNKYGFLQGVELIKDVSERQLPLVGLYTALSHTKQDRIVILSADMPLIKADLILYIWQKYDGKITLYQVRGKTYTFFGVYPKEILKPLEDFLEAGGVRALDFVCSVGYTPVQEEEVINMGISPEVFMNMNTKEDARIILEIYERDKLKDFGNDL